MDITTRFGASTNGFLLPDGKNATGEAAAAEDETGRN
jgi:hypothetical protein